MNTNNRTVCVIGLGYVGLPTAAVIAKAGFKVLGVDTNKDVVESIKAGRAHISEPGLQEIVTEVVNNGYLETDLLPHHANVYMIAVPTLLTSKREPDLSFLLSAIRSLAPFLQTDDLVIIESTVPPKTCLSVVAPMIQSATGLDFNKDYFLAHCPERIFPGNIVHELINNDRTIGGATKEATKKAVDFYRQFVQGKLLETEITTAEMAKLMENTFRDVNIALAHELSQFAEKLDINIFEAIELANHNPRVNIHTPSIGVGGHCLPVASWFINSFAPEIGIILPQARKINDLRPSLVINKIKALISRSTESKISFWGLSFKQNTDDLSYSAAIEIVATLAQDCKEEIYVVEPYITELPSKLACINNVKLISLDEARSLKGLRIKLVNHNLFKDIDLTDPLLEYIRI